MTQTIVALSALLLAIIFLGRRLYKTFLRTKKASGCGGSCGCSKP
jgi:hypothetical protein